MTIFLPVFLFLAGGKTSEIAIRPHGDTELSNLTHVNEILLHVLEAQAGWLVGLQAGSLTDPTYLKLWDSLKRCMR